MISLKLSLDKRRKKLDGTYPIVFRISLNGKTRDIASGFSCKLKEWDIRNYCIKGTSASIDLINGILKEGYINYELKLLELSRASNSIADNIQEVKNYLLDKSETTTIYSYWLDEISRLEYIKNYGNMRNYKSALGGIKAVINLEVPFSTINYKWLINIETKLKAKGVKQNSIAVYMRTLRALYNKAVKSGIKGAESYPYDFYRIKSSTTSPRVISLDELKSFFKYAPTESKKMDAWNYGKLIFLLRGINFIDLALLTDKNINHGRISYKRSKTHKLYSIELLPEAEEIIQYYKSDNRITLLPILTDEEYNNRALHQKRIAQQLRNTNKWLSRIGKELEIKEQISTYVFRYSHAQACKTLGYSKDLISESLGHAYGYSVTSCYLENYNVELIDDMNRKVVNKVIRGA